MIYIKPTDKLSAFKIDKYHDWIMVQKNEGTDIYKFIDEESYNRTYYGYHQLRIVGHLPCGSVRFGEYWTITYAYFFRIFDKYGNPLGFVRARDVDYYSRLNAYLESGNYEDIFGYMRNHTIEKPEIGYQFKRDED